MQYSFHHFKRLTFNFSSHVSCAFHFLVHLAICSLIAHCQSVIELCIGISGLVSFWLQTMCCRPYMYFLEPQGRKWTYAPLAPNNAQTFCFAVLLLYSIQHN